MKMWILWLASLVMVSAFTALAVAQTRLPEPRVVSGDDIGFRVESLDRSGTPIGTLVIRLNGEWIEIAFAGGLRPVR